VTSLDIAQLRRAPENPASSSVGPEPTLSVLVPLLDEADSIIPTLARLLQQDYDRGVEFLLIDGGSADGTLETLEEAERLFPQVRLLHNPARVTTTALNIGLGAARGRYIARMDGHSEYPLNYLTSGVDRLDRGDVASVSGPALARAQHPWARRVALAMNTWLGVGEATFRRPVDRETDVDTGFTGVWERATLAAHGGWDDETYPNEDAELAARIRASGGRIVCIPEMTAYYTPRTSLAALATQYWRYGQYRCRTALRQPNSLRRSHILAPGLAFAAIIAPLRLPVVSRAAAALLALYTLVTTGVAVTQTRKNPRDSVWLPLVFATMHFSWGFGFLRGIVRFGFPCGAFRRLISDLLDRTAIGGSE
jgi:cellulose synthase/poly-beta-1,6-N-acetylglucosamine synthase-like glycosyltransferase